MQFVITAHVQPIGGGETLASVSHPNSQTLEGYEYWIDTVFRGEPASAQRSGTLDTNAPPFHDLDTLATRRYGTQAWSNGTDQPFELVEFGNLLFCRPEQLGGTIPQVGVPPVFVNDTGAAILYLGAYISTTSGLLLAQAAGQIFNVSPGNQVALELALRLTE